MKKKETKDNYNDKGIANPYRIRLPGFITKEEVGLGDAIKRMTYTVGIKPCAGCERRAAALNRWFVFSGKQWK